MRNKNLFILTALILGAGIYFLVPVASSPLVDGDRLYYVSNRAELMCLDVQGFRDKENDGPVTDEKLTGDTNADIVWKFDMIEEVGSLPHNLANSSPVMYGDLIY